MTNPQLIKSAEFVKGAVHDTGLPTIELPEIAFIGRSNVGKSSVINSLTNRNRLARSSSTPGFTAEANFYLINEEFYLVDLPGYGFARGSHVQRDKIARIIEWYFTSEKTNTRKVVLIIDAKVGPTVDDIHFYKFLTELNKDIVIIANKFDKLKQGEIFKSMENIKKEFPENMIIKYSAVEKTGVEELFESIK
ncbi:YihA family ribosome biogenesis GTP-binding protein [Candidatus Parcubacteria bacterium]|nr:YihA family ribosome biogenesis GTP-binding protein [Candidatus Parcubacteria bacterium]